jgi:phosphopantetheinyl transferase
VEPPPAPVAAPADEEAVRTESPPPARASSPAPAPVTSAPLPEAFRVRRPILADRPRPSRPDLTGLVVGIEGVGPVADALVAALRARGAVVGPASSAECVISVGTDVYDLLALARGRDAARPSSWLTVTQAGGLDMVARAGTATGGVATTDTSRVAAVHREGARAGFTKALSHEWRDTTFVRVLDVPPGAAPAEIAAAACDELPRERGATEVFRRGAQRRIIGWKVVNVAPSGVPAATRVLLTGGARGITARIAAELASRAPVVLELVGRGPAGVTPFDEPAAREQARAELKAAGKRVTPVELDKRLAPMRAAEEIRATIVSLEAKGAVVRYHRCDLADPVAVADLVRELQERGPLDLVIHGAGVEESRPIAEKDDAAFHRVFDGKAVGGLALAQAIHPATFFVTMGSVAGRFGNAGQVDYSAANDAMSRVALARPNALSVAWTAWDDVGMAVRGGMRHLLTDRGVGLLPADAGAGVLVDMVAAGVTGEVVVAGALGELWSPPDNPLLDRVEWDGDAVIARRSLTLVGDPWLADHVIEGHAVLPGVVGLELMALTAMEAMPGLPYAGATDVRFDKPVKVYREEPTEVVVEARAVAQGEVQCAVWSERRLRTGKLQRTKSFSATIRLGIAPEIERLPAAILPPEDHDQAAIYRRFFHGPAFQVLTAVTAAASDAATFDGALPASVLTDRTETCPLALEAAFQAAGLLRMLTTHEMALPAFIDEVQLGEVPAPGAPLSILVIQDRDRAQIDIDGPSGPVLRVRGFGMSTLGPLDPARRFSVPDGGRPSLRGRAAGPGGLSPIAQANDAEDPSAWLGHDELAALSARGTERRVQDRIAGRIAAKRALVSMTGLDPHRIVIDNAPTGEPRVLVDGTPSAWRVSIAHREGHAVAIAAGAGRVGIDLESVESRSLSFLADWFHEDEAMERADAHRQTVGWAAKEAVLKVLGTGLALSPRDVLVRAVGRNGQIAVELRGDVAARHRALGGGQLGVTWEAAGPSEVLVVARLTA